MIHIHKHKMCRVVDTLYTQSGASPLWLWEEAHHTFDGDGRSKLSAHMDQVDGELEEKNSNASMVRTCEVDHTFCTFLVLLRTPIRLWWHVRLSSYAGHCWMAN